MFFKTRQEYQETKPKMRAAFPIAFAFAAAALCGPALAAGDPAAGEKDFAKCRTCHSIPAADGTVIQKGAKVGPNLYGVVGRPAGSEADFKYSPSMIEAGEKGLVWDEATVVEYVQDPTAFLKTYLGDDKARGKMTFKLTSGMEDVAAYLQSVAPGS
jgi:cytochrome c